MPIGVTTMGVRTAAARSGVLGAGSGWLQPAGDAGADRVAHGRPGAARSGQAPSQAAAPAVARRPDVDDVGAKRLVQDLREARRNLRAGRACPHRRQRGQRHDVADATPQRRDLRAGVGGADSA